MRRYSHHRAFLAFITLITLPLFAACGGEEMGEEPMEEPAEQEEMPMEQESMEPAPQPTMASLTALNDSGVTGGVEFTREDGTLTVAVSSTNLGGAGDYPSHIHQGTCESPGGVVVPLESPSAGDDGIGEAVTEVDATQLEPGTSYLVMVHSLDGAPVACAEVPPSVLGTGM